MDLTNSNNWARVGSWNRRANLISKHGSGIGAVEFYDPIPPIYTSLATPIGLIKTTAPSNEIKPNWFKACRANAYLNFVPGVRDRIFSKVCGLNQGTFLQLPNVGKFPYQLELVIPDYLISLYVELWQFTDSSGKYLPASEQVVLSAVEVVEQRQRELEVLVQQQKQTT